jgi:hypothetical protein
MKLEIFGQNEDKRDTCILRLTGSGYCIKVRAVKAGGSWVVGGFVLLAQPDGTLYLSKILSASLGFQLERGSIVVED